MYLDSRFRGYGQLDAAARVLESALEELKLSWDDGEYRMRHDDCKRLAEYLSRIEVSTSAMRDTLKLFEALAKKPQAQLLLKTIIHHEKDLPVETAQLSSVGTD